MYLKKKKTNVMVGNSILEEWGLLSAPWHDDEKKGLIGRPCTMRIFGRE